MSVDRSKIEHVKLVFVDETSDAKFRDYLGLCVATIDSYSYAGLKTEARRILTRVDWDSGVEFKGSYLFSASKGCTDVQVEQRIKAAGDLLDLNVASKNTRMRFAYCRSRSASHAADYLGILPELMGRALKSAPKGGGGKNLMLVQCDEREDVDPDELHDAIAPAVEEKGYVVVERVAQVRSGFDTVGLMFADLVGYLAGRVDTISNDSGLFEGLTPEQLKTNGKIRKLRSSSSLIRKLKALDLYLAKREEGDGVT